MTTKLKMLCEHDNGKLCLINWRKTFAPAPNKIIFEVKTSLGAPHTFY
jgi:hypothetical protein